MKGFTRVPFASAEAGDLLVVSASARALHTSPKTLSRHGLWSGHSRARSRNSAMLVERALSTPRGEKPKKSVLWVWSVSSAVEPAAEATNSIEALTPKTTISSMELVPAGRGLLPTTELWNNSGGTPVTLPVPGLKEAVQRRFREMPAKLEQGWMYGRSAREGWQNLRALAERLDDPLASVPPDPAMVARTRNEDGVLWKRVLAENPRRAYFGWMSPNWDGKLTVNGAFAKFMEANGTEVWRPTAKKLDELADAVLAAHAERCARELESLRSTLADMLDAAAQELLALGECGAWWSDRARGLLPDNGKEGEHEED